MPRRRGTTALAKKVGARIRALRTEAKITQEQLAWSCDLDKGFMSQIESGKRLPSVPVLAAIATRLELDLVDVLAIEPGKPKAAYWTLHARRMQRASRRPFGGLV